MPAELAREVALVYKTAVRGDNRHQFIGIDQRMTRHAEPQLAEIGLRREVETIQKLPLERPQRHMRHRANC